MTEKVVIGSAELWHADCREVLPLLPKHDLLLTDPPYGVGVAAWDARMPVDWFGDVLALLPKTGAAYVFGDPVELARFQVYWASYGVQWKARCAWTYEDGPRNAKTWTRKHEDCLVWHGPNHKQQTPTEPSIHADPRWGDDRLMGDVWTVPRVLGNYGEREDHPSQKPVELIVRIARSATAASSVLDPFAGSGTTGVACAQLGKAFTGIERERRYFDIACERIARAQAQGKLWEPEAEQQEQQELL